MAFVQFTQPDDQPIVINTDRIETATPLPHFPRLRTLALFGRRPVERAERLGIAGVQKPAQEPAFN